MRMRARWSYSKGAEELVERKKTYGDQYTFTISGRSEGGHQI